MFKLEVYRHWDLIPALRLYNDLLDTYRSRLGKFAEIEGGLEELQHPELSELRPLLHQCGSFIERLQNERAEAVESMRHELRDWERARLREEIQIRISAYSSIPADSRKSVDDEHSVTLLGFTRVFQREREYVLDRIEELGNLLKDEDFGVSEGREAAMKMNMLKALSRAQTEDELWELMNVTKREHSPEYWAKIEYHFYIAVRRFRKNRVW